MSSIFRETSITWDGATYEFVPALSLLRKIERGRPGEGPVSLIAVAQSAVSGAPLMPLMCQIITDVMLYAGATGFTEDDVYQEALTGNAAAVNALWWDIYTALSPVPKEQKKADAPESE